MNQELQRLTNIYKAAKVRLQASYREDTMGNYLGDPAFRTTELNKAAIAIADFVTANLA